MFRFLFVSILLFISLEASQEKFNIIANDVKTINKILTAKGNVVLFSPTYYMTAEKIIYDQNKNTLELFDDVVILKNNNIQLQSNYAFLNLSNDDLYQKPSMLFEEQNELWIKSKDSLRNNNIVNANTSSLSTCDCDNPDWSIKVSSSSYDLDKKWINTFNTRFYIKNIPVFYIPYFGFSTSKKRQTGFLSPIFGYSSAEGTFYSQALFIAPADNYDIEIIPQIRNQRGKGIYTYVRYADSPTSMMKFKIAYFKEKKSFVKKYNLRSDEHYGAGFNYEKYNIFSKHLNPNLNARDGLYVNLEYLNDIEFRTLEENKYKSSTEKKIESKINYYFDTSKYYTGAYFRYYIDTIKKSNASTIQELPKLQFHSYSKSFIFKKLLYSFDSKYTSYTRSKGLNVNEYEFFVPFSYSFPLLDNYINISIKEELSFKKYEYSNADTKYKDGIYAHNNTILEVSSDLIKAYDNYLHTMNLNLQYAHPNDFKKSGDLYKITNNDTNLSPFPITESKKNISFGINQSLYNDTNLKQIINHKLRQTIVYDKKDNLKLQNMENEIIYNYILGSVSNKFLYNHQDKKLIESSSSFSLTYDNYYMKLGHYVSKETLHSGKEDLESYQVSLKYKLSRDYSIGYEKKYDMMNHITNKQSLILYIEDKCWSANIKFQREITTASTNKKYGLKQDIIYFQLFLKPFIGIEQEYEIKRHK